MKQKFLSALSVIAALAITKSVLDYFKFNTTWFALLLTCLVVGISTFLLPSLVEKFNVAYSIIATGFSVLLMIPFAKLPINSEQKYWCVFCLIVFVAVLTDVFVSYMSNHNYIFYNLIFDIALCSLSNYAISKFNNDIITIVILLITFSLVLLIDFSFKFSIKRKKKEEKIENTQTTVKGENNINIPMGKRSSIDVPIE